MAALLHRSRSKDRTSTAGHGLYMSKKQMGEYLEDLRSNRVSRPTGARPLPPSSTSSRTPSNLLVIAPESETAAAYNVLQNPLEPAPSTLHRSSHPSHHRNDSSASITSKYAGRPLVQQPTAEVSLEETAKDAELPVNPVPYLESGQRWMERLEARSLRVALEDMDLMEEQRLHKAAQDEASELVWKHQNPNASYASPEKQFNYREHLKRGSHARSQSWAVLQDAAPGVKSSSTSRSTSGSSVASKVENHPKESLSTFEASSGVVVRSATYPQLVGEPGVQKLDSTDALFSQLGRRRTSASRRKSSGPFINPNDQIYEEPEDVNERVTAKTEVVRITSVLSQNQTINEPVALAKARRNPFSRVQQAKESLTRSHTAPLPEHKPASRTLTKRLFKNNPPTIVTPSSDMSGYVLNTDSTSPTPPGSRGSDENITTKDGIEVRSNDIRAATSMKMKDRSPKLPTPTMVSDSPGRPIVSFQHEWKPKEKIVQEVVSRAPEKSTKSPGRLSTQGQTDVVDRPYVAEPSLQQRPVARSSFEPVEDQMRQSVPVIDVSGPLDREPLTVPSISIIGCNDSHSKPQAETISANASRPSPVPFIAISEVSETKTLPNPRISVPGKPSAQLIPIISVSSTPAIPTISVDPSVITPARPLPSISVSSAPSVPTISINTADGGSNRPLPTPKKGMTFPRPNSHLSSNRKGPSHWTPTAFNSGALCCHCALPISGRTVSAAGSRFHPECFGCYHCGEKLECVAFYPEPENVRAVRIERIRRRQSGEIIEGYVTNGVLRGTEEDDGDEGMRFYCHLDFHEFFSPRCKSCKTPIEGEVVVACGAEWHVGHFFCAQCGDPFDPHTPFVEKDNYAWCINCHTNRFSAKCKKCRKPVTNMVIKALGAEWHDKCFCCTECNGPFVDGRYFLRGSEDQPVCVSCEERRLKA